MLRRAPFNRIRAGRQTGMTFVLWLIVHAASWSGQGPVSIASARIAGPAAHAIDRIGLKARQQVRAQLSKKALFTRA